MTESLVSAAIEPDEYLLDLLTAKHRELLSSYFEYLKQGPIAVRDMILADIKNLFDVGAEQRIADLCVVLDCFFSLYPETRPA